GVVFCASSGDSGAGVGWPAISPYVVSVGGTTLNLNPDNTRQSETGWSGSGGGVSADIAQPAWQSGFYAGNTSQRLNPDVSYDGDPNTGFPVYDSTPYSGQVGWFQVGGTSAGSPQWAGLVAIANQRRGAGRNLSNLNPVLYSLRASFYDVTQGSNGGF